MTQYINLLNPALRVRREALSLATLGITLAAVVLVLAGAGAFMRQRTEGARTQVALGEAQLRADQEKLVASNRGVAAAMPDPRLVAELEVARTTLQARESALAQLASGSLGNTTGFSEQFRAFARQSASGLWLTGFTLSGAGTDILIQGRALLAEQVPAYIQRLKDEPVFRGKSFAALRIEEGRIEKRDGPSQATQPRAAPAFVEFRLMSSVDMAAGPDRKAFDAPLPGGKP